MLLCRWFLDATWVARAMATVWTYFTEESWIDLTVALALIKGQHTEERKLDWNELTHRHHRMVGAHARGLGWGWCLSLRSMQGQRSGFWIWPESVAWNYQISVLFLSTLVLGPNIHFITCDHLKVYKAGPKSRLFSGARMQCGAQYSNIPYYRDISI